MIELGRTPNQKEFQHWDRLRAEVGSAKKAVSLLASVLGHDAFSEARRRRRDDLLVFLASCHFQRKIRWSDFSESLQTDIKRFFRDLKSGLSEARDVLFAAGDPDEIELACENLELGWQDEQALYFHRSLLPNLPVILRVYVDCACRLYGDPEEEANQFLDELKGLLLREAIEEPDERDLVGKTKPVMRTPAPAELRVIFLGQSGGPLELVAGKHYRCDTVNADLRKDASLAYKITQICLVP